ncbi:MAG: hypothetical protein H7A49_04025 [Akkermansiaceae bacterium]|nr:hypothetical protein [Akkermansiaceae bacterium]
MQSHPQPPPDVPVPVPSEQAKRSRRWMVGIWLVGMLSVVGVVVMASLPLMARKSKCRGVTPELNNSRQIGLALLDFETEFGSMPNADTLAKLRTKHPASTVPMGTATSNDFFRQLIVTGCAQSEGIFFARSVQTPKWPDDFTHGNHALEKGECSFSYILDGSSSADPPVPVAIAPLARGKKLADMKTLRKYDSYERKVVALMSDNSARTFPVDMKTGRILHGAKDLFDPSQPFWHGKAPVVVWPE